MNKWTFSWIAMLLIIVGIFLWRAHAEDEYIQITDAVSISDVNMQFDDDELSVMSKDDPDNVIWFDDIEMYPDLTIVTETGGELRMSFKGDVLEITGDADMNEAAEIFFKELLKPMADAYIKERLKE